MQSDLKLPSLRMSWARAPWDEEVCGFPVLQITEIEVTGPNAERDFRSFEQERDSLNPGLVSCRLPHSSLVESMLLEDHGFRFIEMMFQPEISLTSARSPDEYTPLLATRANEGDLATLAGIASTSFQHERFKMDPRLDAALSDRRYSRWVANSIAHPTQELYVLRADEAVVAFFIVEFLKDGTCYWHLNAVAPDAQGQGHGKRAWLTMLSLAAERGARRVRTSIVARNHRVLNLYARLGFYFSPPLMTFHWVSPTI